VTVDELDAVTDELVGDRDALLRIGHVVAEAQHDVHAEDAASRVDVVARHLGALLQLRAEGRVRARQRAGDADGQIGRLRSAGEYHAGSQHDAGKPMRFHMHVSLL
jgi:hypothetical protein